MDQPMATVTAGSTELVNPVSAVQKKYCSRALVTAVIIGAVLIGLGYVPLGKGLVLGALFSVLNFVLMGSVMPLKMGHGRGKTMLIAMGGLAVRMLLLALPMAVALKMETFHLVSTMIGIFTVQIMILSDYIGSLVFQGMRKKIAGN